MPTENQTIPEPQPIANLSTPSLTSRKEDQPPAQPSPTKPKSKRATVFLLLSIFLIVALAWAIPEYIHARDYATTDDAFIEAHVTQMSPRISTHVVKVLVNDNQLVKKNDLLLELDARDFEVQHSAALAKLASAQARLEQARAQETVAVANTGQAEADLDVAQANAENANSDFTRAQNLIQTKVISGSELDSATAKSKSSNATVESARKKAGSMKAQISAAQAQIVAAQAEVQSAEVDVQQQTLQLSYTKIVAPENGRITRKNVEVGDYVQPGQALFALVQPEVWVVANFKETQLQRIKPGQPVVIKVDTYHGKALKGHVDSIQSGTGSRFSTIPPENATGNYVKVVQRLPVKIVFDESLPDEELLAPGMSVIPEIKVR